MKKTGFTMIELTISILVISIILVLLIFPFRKNLQITRDTVRKTNVSMMANIIKLNQIDARPKYHISKKKVLQIFRENLISLPKIESDNHYYYGHSTVSEDFFVVVCKESRENFFIAGTDGGKEALSAIYPKKACENGNIPIGERFIPLKNSRKPIDSYLVYRII